MQSGVFLLRLFLFVQVKADAAEQQRKEYPAVIHAARTSLSDAADEDERESRTATFPLLNQLFEYATMHEIISKERNLSEYINIGEEEQSTKHHRFTYDEVDAL